MAVNLDSIDAKLQAAGGPARMYFAPAPGGYRFSLTGEVITGDLYRMIMARFAPTPPIILDGDAKRRNRLRGIADARDGGGR